MTEQSITKIDDNLFYLVGPILSEYRDQHWMNLNSEEFVVEIINKNRLSQQHSSNRSKIERDITKINYRRSIQ